MFLARPSPRSYNSLQYSRYDRSWGHLFSTFEDFLAFSWPCITVTDVWTGRAHIVTRLTSIGAFLKMIKTRSVSSTFSCSVYSYYLQIRRNTASSTKHPPGVSFRVQFAAFAYGDRLCQLQEAAFDPSGSRAFCAQATCARRRTQGCTRTVGCTRSNVLGY